MAFAAPTCLILACGNTLRSDDGVGPWLCAWAADRYAADTRIRTIARQQWTPDLAADIADSKSILFIDCSVESAAGSVQLRAVTPAAPHSGLATHHTGAAELLSLADELYGAGPLSAQLLTIGAGSLDLGETFSEPVQAALTLAQMQLETAIHQLLDAGA